MSKVGFYVTDINQMRNCLLFLLSIWSPYSGGQGCKFANVIIKQYKVGVQVVDSLCY